MIPSQLVVCLVMCHLCYLSCRMSCYLCHCNVYVYVRLLVMCLHTLSLPWNVFLLLISCYSGNKCWWGHWAAIRGRVSWCSGPWLLSDSCQAPPSLATDVKGYLIAQAMPRMTHHFRRFFPAIYYISWLNMKSI